MADKHEYKFSINKTFAKKFEEKKRRSELEHLKAKYGDSKSDTDSSSSETEDEDAKEVTSQKEKEFLTVLSLLKKKDPKIYDKNANFYESESSSDSEETDPKPVKPVYLKDFERQQLLEKGSKAFVSGDESDAEHEENENLTYNEEQKALKDSFKVAVRDVSGEDEGDFLSLRTKTEQEKKKEDDDYKEWLKGLKKESKDTVKDLDALQRYWNDPSLDEDEQFLKNYILDKGYKDKDDMRIPTYNEIVDEEKEDEDELEKQEEFERKFNFRFEEPDSEFIKTYPRTVRGSVRQKDDKRTEARKKREDRKQKEKEQKREELKRLKNLKKKEIEEKLERLKEITGNPNVGFTEEDMEGDFDPKKYDNIMQKVFDDDYYHNESDDEKPTFDDGLDLGNEEENWDDWDGNYDNTDAGYYENTEEDPNAGYNDAYYDDGNFNMDADYDPSIEEHQPKRQKKRSSALSRALTTKKPLYDPNEKTFEEYFDEYYKLDYEDIIGDLPCRFKYRKVLPNDYGLSTEEVITFPERELNEWVSVKRMSQYRTDDEERKDLKKYRKLSRDEQRRKRIFVSKNKLAQSENNEETSQASSTQTQDVSQQLNGDQEKSDKKQYGKQHSKPFTKTAYLAKKGWKKIPSAAEAKSMADKKRLARKFKGANKNKLTRLSAERLAAYGMKRKKKNDD